MAACTACDRPAPDAQLCRGCLDQLRAELRALLPVETNRLGVITYVPGLLDELQVTLTRQARIGARGPRGAETPLPYHHGASVDLETLAATLTATAATVAQQRGVRVDTDGTTAGAARWLLRWSGELAQHPDAATLYDDIVALVQAVRRTIDAPVPRRYVGPCDECGADLYAPMGASVVECHGTAESGEPCAMAYGIEERRTWLLEQAVDQLRTAAELSRELPWIGGLTIDRKLINQWAARGQVTRYLPHPNDVAQRPRFRVGEVIDRARRTASDQVQRAAS